MMQQIQKSPNRAETGFSENIHINSANKPDLSMVLNTFHGQQLISEFLDKYEELLQRFDITPSTITRGMEFEAFLALVNIERSLNQLVREG